MCLVTHQTEPLIAQKDIRAYKLFRKDLSSPHQGFQYERGKLYKTEFTFEVPGRWNGEFHYYDHEAINYYEMIDPQLSIEKGFHGAINISRLGLKPHQIIIKYIIPKGSKYYLDGTGLIVSDQILIP